MKSRKKTGGNGFNKNFLTPPNTRKEKITLLVMLVATFVIFQSPSFGPFLL